MKKYLILAIVIISTLLGCENDDFCVDPVTPNLVIRFYDNNDPTVLKRVRKLYVWVNELDTIYENVASDSIAIPLNPLEDFTILHLSADDIQDDITINYNKKEVFVGRSCGYKYNFENIGLTEINNNWILDTEITNETVENETEHIKILH
ncbi:DUF6452 family protein [Urechidicola croceus]|uniref:Lipoprotein n=1 Tax=Urechidicola croceus TaxID=1850246 RepID=A0A1D8P614_9FLAO|nr:DUF6452 family protein [Urechidicola croceus]AOW20014.1 hypothetical protein LPB138_04650 [Urechidicola croceus]